MKSIGELMKEIGFNKDAPYETQKAFIKQLINNAYNKDLKTKDNLKTKLGNVNEKLEAQLHFDLEVPENKSQKVS